MSPEPHEPIPGAGIRHAAGLAVSVVLPLAYAAGAAGAAGIDGFPLWPVVGLAIVTTLVAALASVAFPLPTLPRVLARVTLVVLVALGVRLTVPTPGRAWAEIRSGEGRLFSGTTLLVLVLLTVAYAVGHGFADLVSRLATEARTTELARQHARRAMVAWWWSMAAVVFVAGVTPAAHDVTASVLIVAAAVVSLALLADLRVRTPPPAGTRPPVVATPRRVRLAAIVSGGVVIVGLTAVLTPLVPVEGLRALPSTAWLDWEFDGRRPSQLIEAVTGGGVADREDVDESLPGPPEREWAFPTVPWPVWVALGALLLTVVLRPQRWRMGLRRLWATVRRSRWLGGDAAAGELTGLDDDVDDASARAAPGRLQRTLDRLRPRPREPRAAVLFDYLHVERLLARQERGRAEHETPHEHAVRIHVSAAHAELADLAADARYARRPPDAAAVARARALRREIERASRTSPQAT